MMIKQVMRGTTIEIWHKDYINKEEWMAIEERDKDAEIIQAEYAYDDWFIVEVRRPWKPEVKTEKENDEVKKFLDTVEVIDGE